MSSPAGDIDLSVGAVLALAGSTAAYCLKVLGIDPMAAVRHGHARRQMPPASSTRLLTVGFGLPAFIATLGMYYIARGLAAWIVAGQQLTGFPENFNLLGRKMHRHSRPFRHLRCRRGHSRASPRRSACRPLDVLVAIIAGIVLGYTPFGQQVYATGGNLRAAAYAGINTGRVRFLSLVFCGALRGNGGHHQRRLSFAASTRSPASFANLMPSPP